MRILVVEDNTDILATVVEYLEQQGYQVDCAQNGLGALHLAETQHYEIIILDVILPGMDGYRLCQRLREDIRIDTAIIMLTARDTLDDRLMGLNLGADDYLVKPFALSELVARMEAINRRRAGRKRKLQVADLVLDLDQLQAERAGQPLKLSPTSLKLLELLMRKSPGVVPKQQLEELVWGEDLPDNDSLRAYIQQLRRSIDKPFDRPLLHTVHSIGYQLALPYDPIHQS